MFMYRRICHWPGNAHALEKTGLDTSSRVRIVQPVSNGATVQDQVPSQDKPDQDLPTDSGPGDAIPALPKRRLGERFRHFLLDLDARLDFGLFRGGLLAREGFERYRDFMDRYHVAGWRRWLIVEPLSEAATMGLAGLVLMLALAGPAFRETADEDWLKKSELAVTFL